MLFAWLSNITGMTSWLDIESINSTNYSIEKPKIDPLAIDPDKKSPFMEEVAAIPFDPFNPKFVEEGTDYSIKEIAKGIKLIHVKNPLNDLFTLELRMEKGIEA